MVFPSLNKRLLCFKVLLGLSLEGMRKCIFVYLFAFLQSIFFDEKSFCTTD